MSTSAADFFRLVLPQDGWKCLFTISGTPPGRHWWFKDIDQMATAALQMDASGLAVYHGNAAFEGPPGEKRKRKQAHATQIKSFWLDVDVGAKGYPSLRDALAAVDAWRVSLGLPQPLYVNSGYGLHVYWPLAASAPLAEWLPVAMKLQGAAQAAGLKIDPVTGDAARVLRPPGTHNRKAFGADGKKIADVGGTPRPVIAGDLPPPCEFAIIASKVANIKTPEVAGPSLPLSGGSVLPPELRALAQATTDNLVRGTHDPSDPELVAAACGQVSLLRDARGDLPEPLWYAVLGVLGHCGEVGRTLAHQFSSGDPRYSPADTERKLDQAVRNAGPTTCARFEQLNAERCLGCAYRGRISSPIQLGRPLSAPQLAAKPMDTGGSFADAVMGRKDSGGNGLPFIPAPFFWGKNGQLKIRIPTSHDDSTPPDEIVVSDYPIAIGELLKSERGEGTSAVFRSWEPMQARWVDFVLDLQAVYGDRGMSLMAKHGVVIAKKRWPHFLDFIAKSVVYYRAVAHYGLRYDQFGWKNGLGFVVGEELFRAGAPPARAYGSPEVTRRGKLMLPHGDLATWRGAAAQLFGAPGMEAHAFGLLCGFAAPLYKFTGAGGGTIVHLQSIETGTGKSTILESIEWIWGDIFSIQLIQKDTVNAKFVHVGVLCHLPVVFDEIRAPDPELVKEFVLHFTLGRDKQRAHADGGLRSDNLPWSTILVSASNLSLIDTVQHDGSEVAHAARIFEFVPKMPAGVKVSEGDALKEILRANSGQAGRAFVQTVLDNYQFVADAVPKAMRVYEAQLGGGTEMRFIVRLFASVAVAGMLCAKFGILNLPVMDIMAWAVAMAKDNRKRLKNAAREGDIGSVLGGLINDMVPMTLVMPGPPKRGPAGNVTSFHEIARPRGELAARYELEGRRLYIDTRAVKAWMVLKNFPFTEIEKRLVESKALVATDTKRSLGSGSSLPTGQVRCWEIDGTHPFVAGAMEEIVAAPAAPDNVVHLAERR